MSGVRIENCPDIILFHIWKSSGNSTGEHWDVSYVVLLMEN
jgi:hypothetical protein